VIASDQCTKNWLPPQVDALAAAVTSLTDTVAGLQGDLSTFKDLLAKLDERVTILEKKVGA